MEEKKTISISLSTLICIIIILLLIVGLIYMIFQNEEIKKKSEQDENVIKSLQSEIETLKDSIKNIEDPTKEDDNNQISNTTSDTNTNTSNNTAEKQDSNISNNTNDTKKENVTTEIIGNWSPYKAEENGEEISLRAIYGSNSEGYLTFKSDGTYTEYIGVYSSEVENDLKGTYTVDGNSIILITANGNKKTLEYIKDASGKSYIKEHKWDNTYVFFEK